jgi:hypothetical protein
MRHGAVRISGNCVFKANRSLFVVEPEKPVETAVKPELTCLRGCGDAPRIQPKIKRIFGHRPSQIIHLPTDLTRVYGKRQTRFVRAPHHVPNWDPIPTTCIVHRTKMKI